MLFFRHGGKHTMHCIIMIERDGGDILRLIANIKLTMKYRTILTKVQYRSVTMCHWYVEIAVPTFEYYVVPKF